jgi:hypothetical protein
MRHQSTGVRQIIDGNQIEDGCLVAMLDEQSSKGTFLQLPPMSHQKINQSTQALVRKSMKTKSKMAGIAVILDKWRR